MGGGYPFFPDSLKKWGGIGGPVSGHQEATLGSTLEAPWKKFRAHFRCDFFAHMCAQFEPTSESISPKMVELAEVWAHFGSTLETLWKHLESTLRGLRAHFQAFRVELTSGAL